MKQELHEIFINFFMQSICEEVFFYFCISDRMLTSHHNLFIFTLHLEIKLNYGVRLWHFFQHHKAHERITHMWLRKTLLFCYCNKKFFLTFSIHASSTICELMLTLIALDFMQKHVKKKKLEEKFGDFKFGDARLKSFLVPCFFASNILWQNF